MVSAWNWIFLKVTWKHFCIFRLQIESCMKRKISSFQKSNFRLSMITWWSLKNVASTLSPKQLHFASAVVDLQELPQWIKRKRETNVVRNLIKAALSTASTTRHTHGCFYVFFSFFAPSTKALLSMLWGLAFSTLFFRFSSALLSSNNFTAEEITFTCVLDITDGAMETTITGCALP